MAITNQACVLLRQVLMRKQYPMAPVRQLAARLRHPPKFPTEISRGPRFEMRSAGLLAALDKEQGAERARRTQGRRSERSDAVTQRCAQSRGSRRADPLAPALPRCHSRCDAVR